MADEEAEQAFFQAQVANADAADPVPTEEEPADVDDDDDEYDPSKTLDEEYQPSAREFQDDEEDLPDDSTLNPTVSSDIDTVAAANAPIASQNPSRTESQRSTPVPPAGASVQPQTRTIGGFVDEEDDEDDKEEADYEPPAALEVDEANAMPMTLSEDPSSGNAIQNTLPDVSSQPAVHSAASVPDVANSSYSPVPVSNIDPSASGPTQWALHDASLQNSTVPTPVPDSPSASRGRLPHDRVGILQDRVDEDPRGDIPAWLELISEHRSRNRLDSAREVYERFLKLFPDAADQWVAYATMESELNELYRLEQIFSRTLLTVPSVQLWSVYLDYVRRRNPLTTDTSGDARRVISSAYDLALQYVGMDKDCGNIWSDYVEFIRSGPGTVGGSGWQDQQKMDLLRKAYQKAICVPNQAVNTLWKEYDQFEMGLNKLTGRKFLQEHSPSYMTARSSQVELQNITRDLVRTSLPRLPPVPGSEGDVEFAQQVDIWKRWIAWEKEDPLVLQEDDAAAFKSRVLYVYKQALMALRFLPEMWFDAAEFCFLNNMEKDGSDLLKKGIEANPESCLLSFKLADRLEVTSDTEQDVSKRAAKVKEPYDKLLDALYDLIEKARNQEAQDVSRIEETFAKQNPDAPPVHDEDDDDAPSEAKEKEAAKKAQIDAVREAHSIQINTLSKTISFAWVALMRAMRRISGKGKPGEVAGSRSVFADARKRGRITSDVYIASALMEYHCYKDPAATRIFERGAKLFPEDENFALEYLKHLIDINDIINARAVFELTVRRLATKPENVEKAKPIFAFLHEYESRYGDLVQVINLETRMRELYPEDPLLDQFSHRYSTPIFDPMTVRPILSPSQTRPKSILPGMAQESRSSPVPHLDTLNSPKRPFPTDDFDYDSDRPRKFVRAESPLKAVQGRRLDQQKRGINGQTTSSYKPQGSSTPLPREVVQLLSIIPHASAYNIARLSPEKMVDLIRCIDVPSSPSHIPLPANARGLGAPQSSGTNPPGGQLRHISSNIRIPSESFIF
ncbi:RNA-processing protein HAT helix [Penicillium macrosclerotiorum]|uniref:RNA-processing protein HAT helix n=1 Tax=Penicillium macrosclerotiorum TaxID=303699 RepID=UPI002547D711|nr:RNA-processing protein HAT helix [Penicillium macrosclerotiorum]KAJ5674104.1 RNA-processing protein HAT helix [Penicillium macrosclerotiorum]